MPLDIQSTRTFKFVRKRRMVDTGWVALLASKRSMIDFLYMWVPITIMIVVGLWSHFNFRYGSFQRTCVPIESTLSLDTQFDRAGWSCASIMPRFCIPTLNDTFHMTHSFWGVDYERAHDICVNSKNNNVTFYSYSVDPHLYHPYSRAELDSYDYTLFGFAGLVILPAIILWVVLLISRMMKPKLTRFKRLRKLIMLDGESEDDTATIETMESTDFTETDSEYGEYGEEEYRREKKKEKKKHEVILSLDKGVILNDALSYPLKKIDASNFDIETFAKHIVTPSDVSIREKMFGGIFNRVFPNVKQKFIRDVTTMDAKLPYSLPRVVLNLVAYGAYAAIGASLVSLGFGISRNGRLWRAHISHWASNISTFVSSFAMYYSYYIVIVEVLQQVFKVDFRAVAVTASIKILLPVFIYNLFVYMFQLFTEKTFIWEFMDKYYIHMVFEMLHIILLPVVCSILTRSFRFHINKYGDLMKLHTKTSEDTDSQKIKEPVVRQETKKGQRFKPKHERDLGAFRPRKAVYLAIMQGIVVIIFWVMIVFSSTCYDCGLRKSLSLKVDECCATGGAFLLKGFPGNMDGPCVSCNRSVMLLIVSVVIPFFVTTLSFAAYDISIGISENVMTVSTAIAMPLFGSMLLHGEVLLLNSTSLFLSSLFLIVEQLFSLAFKISYPVYAIKWRKRTFYPETYMTMNFLLSAMHYMVLFSLPALYFSISFQSNVVLVDGSFFKILFVRLLIIFVSDVLFYLYARSKISNNVSKLLVGLRKFLLKILVTCGIGTILSVTKLMIFLIQQRPTLDVSYDVPF
ncbi:hypothetical protein PCE1_002279 [Barthelona sp. PCE]